MQAFDLNLLNWASALHHGTNEMAIQHQSVPDGQSAALIQKRTEYPESLGCFTSNLIYVTRLGKSLIQGDPQIFDFFFLSNLFSEKPEWTRWRNGSSKEYGCTHPDIDAILGAIFPVQIFDQKCWLLRR